MTKFPWLVGAMVVPDMTGYLSGQVRKGRRARPRYGVLSRAEAPTWPTALSINSLVCEVALPDFIYNSPLTSRRIVSAILLGRYPRDRETLRRTRLFDSGLQTY